MCGIVGVVTGFDNQYSLSEILPKMAKRIIHRGPDYSGLYFDKDLSFCCAHQRLSILDLSKSGNQPMHSFLKRYIIAFNGEIYNFKELKKKLSFETNIVWKGNSDTEVLLNGIEYWGLEETLKLCKGMFAFSLLDKYQKKLFLVRDRFGEKPIYWGFVGSGSTKALLFGSDLNAFRDFPNFDKEINIKSLDAFMQFSYIPSDLTIYQNIKKLKAGSICEFNLSKNCEEIIPKIYKWWNYEKVIHSGINNQFESKKEAINYLEENLKNAIIDCSNSDVPIGCFLSGGIDSSLIASLLSHNLNSKINTFTIGFEDKNYDESSNAKQVANFLGTNHEEIILMPNEALNLIPQLPKIYSEPFADSSQVPTALICREIKKSGISVALTGDGGDEIFGGYIRHFKGANTWSKLKLIPYPLRSIIGSLLKKIPEYKVKNFDLFMSKNISQKILKIASRLQNIKNYNELYKSLLTQNLDKSIYSKSLTNKFNDPFEEYYYQLNKFPKILTNDPVGKMLYWDAISYLVDDILVKVDRASMAFSLETRAPFLDIMLIETAWKIPTKMKVNNAKGKLILKELLSKYIPKDYVYRPKRGFGFPIKEWLIGPLRDWTEELISNKKINEYNHFSYEKVNKIWNDHLNNKVDNTNIIWSILMWQSWLDFYK